MTTTTDAPGAVRQLVGSSRPLSWINTAYPFAAAYLLAGGGITVALVLGTVFFLVPYNLLMYGVNDVFDHESDLRNPRKGGVEGIVLDRRWHTLTLWSAGLLALPFVIALLLLGSLTSALVLVVVLAAVIGYSAPGLRLKERPVLDSLTSSTHF
ncbi:MAG: prenyltransferase, partial [Brachybacterium tyrofermentans]